MILYKIFLWTDIRPRIDTSALINKERGNKWIQETNL